MFNAATAVAPGEAPHPAPVLERAERAGGDAAYAAEAARGAVVPLGQAEGLVHEAPPFDVARAAACACHGVDVGALAGQGPGLVEEDGVIDVEVVIDIVEVRPHELVLRWVVPAGERGEGRLAAAFIADECLEALEEGGFALGEEDGELGVVAVFRDWLAPCLGDAGEVAEERAAPVAEVAFVDEGEGGEGRLFRKAAASARVHVAEEVAGPGAEVAVGRFPEGAEDLEVAGVGDASVTIDADRAPWDQMGAGDEEVGGEVEAVLDAGGHEVVELLPLLGGGGGVVLALVPVAALDDEVALVVVDAEGVVADAGDVGGEAVGGLAGRGEVGGAAEVDAVEALRDAGEVLELEVVADGYDAAELPCGRVVREDGGEVEGRALLDPGVVGERDPVGAGVDGDGVALAEGERAGVGGKEGGVDGVFGSALHGALGKVDAEGEVHAAPDGAVLEEDLGWAVEGAAEDRLAVLEKEGEVRDEALENVGLCAVDGDGDGFAVEECAASGDAGDVAGNHRFKDIGIGGRGDAPLGADGAAGGFGEMRAAIEDRRVVEVGGAHFESAPAFGIGIQAAGGASEAPARKGDGRKESDGWQGDACAENGGGGRRSLKDCADRTGLDRGCGTRKRGVGEGREKYCRGGEGGKEDGGLFHVRQLWRNGLQLSSARARECVKMQSRWTAKLARKRARSMAAFEVATWARAKADAESSAEVSR